MRRALELDIENLVGFFEVKLLDWESGHIQAFRLTPGGTLDVAGLSALLCTSTIYTFNGNGYDLPILVLALYGADNARLKECGDNIIMRGWKWWDVYRHYNIEVPEWIDHVDLMEVAPGVRIGLKMYGARMHAPLLRDLPVAFDKPVGPAMYDTISEYCDNDLRLTHLLSKEIAGAVKLRKDLSAKYGVDMRSKSDAQLSESIIAAELGYKPERRFIPHGYTFKYTPPAYVRFQTPVLQQLLDTVRAADFVVHDKEQAIEMYGADTGYKTGVQIPPELKGLRIPIGKAQYKLGIGGLHSQESGQTVYGDVVDVDVASYYPSLILNTGMFPQSIGPEFCRIYRHIYTERLAAKKDPARAVEAAAYKLTTNGTFGKLFSRYSFLFAPEMGIQTTMTGQLSLLMLIEQMELNGVQVLSANTDGIMLHLPSDAKRAFAEASVKWWEQVTGLSMEYTHYNSVHMRDVNNYIAIKTDGKVKRKGVYGVSGVGNNKHPDRDICSDAVVEYLTKGTPIADTVRACRDVRKFVQVRNVEGGGWYGDLYLGKAVRWYISTAPGHIHDGASRNKVAGSDNAMPLMELSLTLPTDIEYNSYIQHAHDLLDVTKTPT